MFAFTDQSAKSKQVELLTQKKEPKSQMNKYLSEPKFTTFKEQIMKIPKVKQILQKDRFIYSQDIEKRMQLLGNVKNDHFEENQIVSLQQLRKKTQKKNKRHRTNFKIPLTRKNMQSLNSLMKNHISNNQFFKNEERVFLKEYQQNAPFDLQQLKFMDELNPIKKKYKQKFPDFKEGVLAKNKLILQHVILNRNIKREIKLDQKKISNQNGKKVLNSIK